MTDWGRSSVRPRLGLFSQLYLSPAAIRPAVMGKVHGSLARAGKVRSQTPKVAKAEKKKNPKGRAAQRVKYNRRFVNVVTGFGKARGPNSNPTS